MGLTPVEPTTGITIQHLGPWVDVKTQFPRRFMSTRRFTPSVLTAKKNNRGTSTPLSESLVYYVTLLDPSSTQYCRRGRCLSRNEEV